MIICIVCDVLGKENNGTTIAAMNLIRALRIKQKRTVAVYPEVHIWPWYTGIRPFPAVSFAYPVKDGVPAVAFVTIYRKRKAVQAGL